MPSIGAILAVGVLVAALVWWIVLKLMGVGTRSSGTDGAGEGQGGGDSGYSDGGDGGGGG